MPPFPTRWGRFVEYRAFVLVSWRHGEKDVVTNQIRDRMGEQKFASGFSKLLMENWYQLRGAMSFSE